MRIRTTTRPSASPHPISSTIATPNSAQSGHKWALPPTVPISSGAQAIFSVRGADRAPDATTIPLTGLRHATSTDGQVSA